MFPLFFALGTALFYPMLVLVAVAADAPSSDYIIKKMLRRFSAENYFAGELFLFFFLLYIFFIIHRYTKNQKHALRFLSFATTLYFIFSWIKIGFYSLLHTDLNWELVRYGIDNFSTLVTEVPATLTHLHPLLWSVLLLSFSPFVLLYVYRKDNVKIPSFMFKIESHVTQVTDRSKSKTVLNSIIIFCFVTLILFSGSIVSKFVNVWNIKSNADQTLSKNDTDDDLPNIHKLKMATAKHDFNTPFQKRYGFHLAANTNVVILLMESVRNDTFDAGRSKYFSSSSSVRAVDRFYVPVPHSANSHYSIITGNYSSRKAHLNFPYFDVAMSLPSLLQKRGYRSYWIFGGSSLFDNEQQMLKRLPMTIIDERTLKTKINPATNKPYPNFEWGVDDRALLDETVSILDRERGPHFFFIVFTNTHVPYFNPHSDKYKRFNNRDRKGRYQNSIDYTLDLCDNFVEEFKKRKLDDRTLFVLLSDHGESFGEHGFILHDFSLYDTEVRVPAIFRHHDFYRLDDMQSFKAGTMLDVMPTILDLLGFKNDEVFPLSGRSLFDASYHLNLLLTAWGNDDTRGMLFEKHHWIYNRKENHLIKIHSDGSESDTPINKDTQLFVNTLMNESFLMSK